MEDAFYTFENLKFQSSKYNFKNKKDLNEYLDSCMKKSVEFYIREVKNYLKDTLHIFTSYYALFRATFLIGVTLTAMLVWSIGPEYLYLMPAPIAGIAYFASWRVKTSFERRMAFTIAILEANKDILEEEREELIEKSKK
jgi:hypothetical protein